MAKIDQVLALWPVVLGHSLGLSLRRPIHQFPLIDPGARNSGCATLYNYLLPRGREQLLELVKVYLLVHINTLQIVSGPANEVLLNLSGSYRLVVVLQYESVDARRIDLLFTQRELLLHHIRLTEVSQFQY